MTVTASGAELHHIAGVAARWALPPGASTRLLRLLSRRSPPRPTARRAPPSRRLHRDGPACPCPDRPSRGGPDSGADDRAGRELHGRAQRRRRHPPVRRWIAGSHGERDAGRELGAEPKRERIGRPVVVDRQQYLGFVWPLPLLERNPVCGRRPQSTRLGAHVIRREVPERARIDDRVDGVLDQDLELEAERVIPEELDRVREIAVVYQCGPRRDRVGDHDPLGLSQRSRRDLRSVASPPTEVCPPGIRSVGHTNGGTVQMIVIGVDSCRALAKPANSDTHLT